MYEEALKNTVGMTLNEFRDKAKEGGITPHESEWTSNSEMLLSPEWWRAVGKVEGWIYEDGRDVAKYYQNDPKRTPYPMTVFFHHRFIDELHNQITK